MSNRTRTQELVLSWTMLATGLGLASTVGWEASVMTGTHQSSSVAPTPKTETVELSLADSEKAAQAMRLGWLGLLGYQTLTQDYPPNAPVQVKASGPNGQLPTAPLRLGSTLSGSYLDTQVFLPQTDLRLTPTRNSAGATITYRSSLEVDSPTDLMNTEVAVFRNGNARYFQGNTVSSEEITAFLQDPSTSIVSFRDHDHLACDASLTPDANGTLVYRTTAGCYPQFSTTSGAALLKDLIDNLGP